MNEEVRGTRAARREGERGAVLITVLLISTMLLLVGGTLLMTTSLTASGSFDATTELQAYYAAESGLQNSIRVLRGNAAPAPLFAANPTGGVAAQNLINFRRVVTRANSNLAGDPTTNPDGTPFRLRLSRWLTYNYTPPGTAVPDRVTLSAPYSPFNGMAYSVEVVDPAFPTPAAVAAKLAADPNYVPTRLLIKSTGMGPRGARKMLSMMVTNNFFDIDPPAPIVIRGADDGSSMTFDLGSSAAKKYSGADAAGIEVPKPSVAIKLPDWNEAQAGLRKGSTIADPELSILDLDPLPPPASLSPTPLPGKAPGSVKTPYFLQTADAARAFIATTRQVAQDEGKHFNTSKTNFSLGTSADPDFAFIDGNCELAGGAGLLIVTGELVLKG
ncbi:MAG: pilus assembly PilX N-terminal domain-containing protein, partial [Acidobacteria bacterium]|nr:pilus assembly PilX N-terminal domain-containing protein [Acidobacteriota bacterium]